MGDRVFLERIRRRLAKEGEHLRTSRSEGARADLGDHYIVDGRNVVVAAHVDLEVLAEELGIRA